MASINGQNESLPFFKAILAKIPKLTRKQTMIAASIGAFAFALWSFAKPAGQDSASSSWFMPIGSVVGNQNVSGTENHVSFAPPRYRDRSRIRSDGPDYPILMANRLADSNLVKAPSVIGSTLIAMATGKAFKLDPPKMVDVTLNQIALADGTEIEELQSDIDQELRETPDSLKSSARLLAGYHTKVKVLDGKYRGHTGWIVTKLIVRDRVLVTES